MEVSVSYSTSLCPISLTGSLQRVLSPQSGSGSLGFGTPSSMDPHPSFSRSLAAARSGCHHCYQQHGPETRTWPLIFGVCMGCNSKRSSEHQHRQTAMGPWNLIWSSAAGRGQMSPCHWQHRPIRHGCLLVLEHQPGLRWLVWPRASSWCMEVSRAMYVKRQSRP